MDLNEPGLDQVQAGEEPGHLLPGAQGLRRGDALVVDPLRVRLGVVDVDRGMRDRQVAAGRQRGEREAEVMRSRMYHGARLALRTC